MFSVYFRSRKRLQEQQNRPNRRLPKIPELAQILDEKTEIEGNQEVMHGLQNHS